MDAITALALWPNSISEIARAVAEPDSPPTVVEICDVAPAIGDGDGGIIVKGDGTNLRPVIPRKVMSYGIKALAAVGALATIVLLIILYG